LFALLVRHCPSKIFRQRPGRGGPEHLPKAWLAFGQAPLTAIHRLFLLLKRIAIGLKLASSILHSVGDGLMSFGQLLQLLGLRRRCSLLSSHALRALLYRDGVVAAAASRNVRKD